MPAQSPKRTKAGSGASRTLQAESLLPAPKKDKKKRKTKRNTKRKRQRKTRRPGSPDSKLVVGVELVRVDLDKVSLKVVGVGASHSGEVLKRALAGLAQIAQV